MLVLKSIYSHDFDDFRFDTWLNTWLAWLVSQLLNLSVMWWLTLWMHCKITLTHFLLILELIWFSSCWYVFLTWFVLPWIRHAVEEEWGNGKHDSFSCLEVHSTQTVCVCQSDDNEASQHTVTWCKTWKQGNVDVLLGFGSMFCTDYPASARQLSSPPVSETLTGK